MNEASFSYSVTQVSKELLEVHYVGHIGEHDVAVAAEQDVLLRQAAGVVGICYDVSQMTGFHRSQIMVHGNLLLGHRAKICGLALVGARPVIRFGAVSVGMVARLQLKVFDTRPEAMEWLRSLSEKRRAAI